MISTERSEDSARASTGELVRQLTEQLSGLIRGEVRLAQLEVQEKVKKLGAGIGLFAGAAVLAFYLVGVLLAAAVLAFSLILPGWAAALIVAGIMLVIAGLLVWIGIVLVKRGSPPVPQQAIESIKADVEAVKESARR